MMRVTIGSDYNYQYFVTGWITVILCCQILGLISSLITAIVVILFTCVSQTKGNAALGNILKVSSAATGI
jgi:TM2 domain-containing membrane protein YozV